jgi:hypothetical protein
MIQYALGESVNARRRIPVYLVSPTDGLTAVTTEAAGQPQISKNGAAFANTSATLVAVGNGAYYVELTAAELDTLGTIIVRYKSAATAEYSRAFGVVVPTIVRQGIAQGGGASTIILDAAASAVDSFYNGCFVFIVSGTGAGQGNIFTGYVGSTKIGTIKNTWSTNPDATSVFVIYPGTADTDLGSVWDTARASHATAGTFGELVNADAKKIDGSQASATALKNNIANLDSAVSSRSSFAPGADTVTVGTNNDKTGYALSGPGNAQVAAAVLDEPVDNHGTAGTVGERIQTSPKFSISGTVITFYKNDGVTVLKTATISRAAANAIASAI